MLKRAWNGSTKFSDLKLLCWCGFPGGLRYVFVAVQGDQSSGADGDGAQGQGLSHIPSISYTSCVDE